jgi:hypothetical protein
MLRQNAETNEVVEIPAPGVASYRDPDLCPEDGRDCCRVPCYVDECVPPGTYRYGMAPTLGYCGRYYGVVTVLTPLPSDCASSSQAVPTSTIPPWVGVSEDDRACPSSSSDEGCSVGTAPRAVLGVQLAFFLVGLTLCLRRRRLR